MQAQTDQPSTPSVKLRNVGDSITLATTDYTEHPATDIETGEPKLWKNGNQAIDIIVTGLVVKATNAKVLEDGDDVDVEQGQEVSIWFSGPRWYAFITAAKRLQKSLDVGDMIQVVFDHTEPPANKAHSPKQMWEINWGKATKPEMIEWAGKAAAHRQAKNTETLAPAVEAPASKDGDDFDGF